VIYPTLGLTPDVWHSDCHIRARPQCALSSDRDHAGHTQSTSSRTAIRNSRMRARRRRRRRSPR